MGKQPVLSVALVALACVSLPAADDLLERGNDAYRSGDYAEAVKLYEESGSGEHHLARRFNAGVAQLKLGKLDEALASFEKAASLAEGEIQRAANYNLGYCHFQRGAARAESALETAAGQGDDAAAPGTDGIDARIEKLLEAARSYRNAVTFYRRVDPPDRDSEQSLLAAKTALLAVMDQVHKLEEEKKRREEEAALEEPAELIRAIIQKEKTHRRLARALEGAPGNRLRLGSRSLQKAEAENRILTEKLLHYLQAAPESGDPQKPPPDAAAAKRREEAADAVGRGLEAQKRAEAAYARRSPAEAAAEHTLAIADLRKARARFPLDIGTLTKEALAVQEAVLQATEAIQKERGGAPDAGGADSTDSGLGKMLLGALKDKVLRPLAKTLAPSREKELTILAEEEEDVVWAAEILSRAEVRPPPEPPAGAASGTPEPHLDEEQAAELTESLRKEGRTAFDASRRARERLAEGDVDPAVEAEKEALEALRRIDQLLPKPPERLEEKLRKLVERQIEAREAAKALEEIAGEPLAAAAGELSKTQVADGRAAEEIAGECAARRDERARKALPKIREGSERIFSSAESLGRAQPLPREAGASIEKAVKALAEALAILTGEDQGSPGGEQQQQQQPEGEQPGEEPKEGEKKPQDLVLTPRQARMLREEMDRKRREAEAELFSASSTVTVDKDW